MIELLPFAACLALGAVRQRRPGSDEHRTRVWAANIALLIPIAILYAACTIRIDRELAAAFACGIVAWWLVIGMSLGYARLVEPRDRRRRGAIAMSAAFPNTIFLGYPLAHLAYGAEGLQIAVVYDALGPVIPAVVVSTAIARAHASDAGVDRPSARSVLAGVVLSPPTAAMLVAVLLRAFVLDGPLELQLAGEVLGPVAGAVGFYAAGLSIPLDRLRHTGGEVLQVTGVLVLRLLAAPLLLVLVGAAVGVDVPPALVLVSAMPTAVHALVIAREQRLDTSLVRLALLASTLVALLVTAVAVALG